MMYIFQGMHYKIRRYSFREFTLSGGAKVISSLLFKSNLLFTNIWSIYIIKETTISFESYSPLPSLEGIMLPAYTVSCHVIPFDPKLTWPIYGKGETVNPGILEVLFQSTSTKSRQTILIILYIVFDFLETLIQTLPYCKDMPIDNKIFPVANILFASPTSGQWSAH